MKPATKRRCPAAPARQRGISGVLIIAAIAVLGGLSAWALGLATATASGASQALAVARAQQAAAAGVDWGRWRLRIPAAPLCAANQNLVLPGTLGTMTVTTRCTLLGTYSEAGVPVRRWRVVADACNQPLAGACPAANPQAGYAQASQTAFVER
jgi:MSHA biogenesis protein MshP